MFLKTVMMLLCTAGTAFYMRFLVALWEERRPRSGGYWVRLRFDSSEGISVELDFPLAAVHTSDSDSSEVFRNIREFCNYGSPWVEKEKAPARMVMRPRRKDFTL